MSATMCLALAIFFEAGTEPPEGKIAVGWSVVNASTTLHKKPHKICTEVHNGRYIGVNNMTDYPIGIHWKESLKVARSVLKRKVPDPTGGAQFFECTKWKSCQQVPWWSVGMVFKGRFGSQNFWRTQ